MLWGGMRSWTRGKAHGGVIRSYGAFWVESSSWPYCRPWTGRRPSSLLKRLVSIVADSPLALWHDAQQEAYMHLLETL